MFEARTKTQFLFVTYQSDAFKKLLDNKGGLISESFSIWLKSLKKKVPNRYPEHYLFWIVLRIDFGKFFVRFEPK